MALKTVNEVKSHQKQYNFKTITAMVNAEADNKRTRTIIVSMETWQTCIEFLFRSPFLAHGWSKLLNGKRRCRSFTPIVSQGNVPDGK